MNKQEQEKTRKNICQAWKKVLVEKKKKKVEKRYTELFEYNFEWKRRTHCFCAHSVSFLKFYFVRDRLF